MVKIDHGAGVVTLYAHLSSISAIVGQRVAQGERIGAVGNTGSVTAAHLHYEVRLGGAARNPLLWLSSSNHSTRGNPG